MPLDDYRRKRDFMKSPEPPGEIVPASGPGGLAFCVQKHLSSHLHYDLRLEWKGVLLSWAVPKGPSLDPSVRRFAARVEDHPVEYGEFEGVIPEGYGAGIVILWDRGTWEPAAADVDAALSKGDLKFTLHGTKLKGSWAIVRMGSGGRNWLFIKHRDAWAAGTDIAASAPLSVRTGRDFEHILADGDPGIWSSGAPARGGEAGALYTRTIRRAVAMKSGVPIADPEDPAPMNTETPKPAKARHGRGGSAGRAAVRSRTGRPGGGTT